MKGDILIADDEHEIRESLYYVLEEESFRCSTAKNGEEAIEKIREGSFDIVITDLKMPQYDGLEVTDQVNRYAPDTLVMIITAYATVDTAVQALRKGASDYLLKPLDLDEVTVRVNQLMERKSLMQENKYLREQIDKDFNFNHIIGESEAMKEVYDMIERVSQAQTTVLISGKTGTGKELVARAIHKNSPRSDNPFFAINCGATPEDLFASELFGHKKGAFTGASEDKEGVFVAANGGTLFLDEVGEIPLKVQVDLLRVLQEREVKPLGANFTKSFDTRIVAATNRNLYQEVEDGNFREDLYYRLNVVELPLPSLKERRHDIPLLAQHFIEKYNQKVNRSVQGVDSEAMRLMMAYEWKGEVRELENVVERALLLGDSEYVQPEDLPPYIRDTQPAPEHDLNAESLNEAVQSFEKHHIKNILRRTDGNRSEAARLLNIDPSTLYRKMEKLGIQQEEQ